MTSSVQSMREFGIGAPVYMGVGQHIGCQWYERPAVGSGRPVALRTEGAGCKEAACAAARQWLL